MMCSIWHIFKIPLRAARHCMQVWKDEARHLRRRHQAPGWQSWEESLAPGRFLVMREAKEAGVVRGSERRTNLPPGHFFEGGLFMSFSSASFLLLSALTVALRQKSKLPPGAAHSFETTSLSDPL